MQVFVYGKDLEITKAIREFTEEQVKKKFTKISKKVQAVRVYLENITRKESDPTSSIARYTVEVPGKNLVTVSKAHDLYQAITAAAEASARKLRKTKEKILAKKRKTTQIFRPQV